MACEGEMKRRHFMAAATAAAGAPGDQPKRQLKTTQWGPAFYDEAEQKELIDVVGSHNPFRFYAGPNSKVLAFEREFAAYMGTRFALGVSSGTAALQVAMAALGIGPGDEVILPAWTWHSCFNAIVLAGGLPVIAEIDETFNIDPEDIERHITDRTKAIMVAHLQGNSCQIDRVVAIAKKHNLRLVEDAAQSVGASFNGKKLGTFSDIGIYSLQQNKTITAGEGGAVVTNDPALFERAARFHDLGGLRPAHAAMLEKPSSDWFMGANYRMNEFTGGVLLAQMRKIDRIISGVRGAARRVYDGIADLPGIELRKRPDPQGELGAGVFLGFKGKDERERFVAGLKAEGVPAGGPGGSVILPLLPHIQKKVTAHPNWPSFNTPRGKAMRYGPETCPKTVAILDRFGGPVMDPKYTKADTDYIVAAMRKLLAG